MKTREYKSYDSYLKHQGSKLDTPGYLEERQNKFRHRVERFKEKFEVLVDFYEPETGRVLCLAARLGEEIMPWGSLAFEAIGVDINPGPNNQLVIYGDFHYLPFTDNSFDIIYSNSLDYALLVENISGHLPYLSLIRISHTGILNSEGSGERQRTGNEKSDRGRGGRPPVI